MFLSRDLTICQACSKLSLFFYPDASRTICFPRNIYICLFAFLIHETIFHLEGFLGHYNKQCFPNFGDFRCWVQIKAFPLSFFFFFFFGVGPKRKQEMRTFFDATKCTLFWAQACFYNPCRFSCPPAYPYAGGKKWNIHKGGDECRCSVWKLSRIY